VSEGLAVVELVVCHSASYCLFFVPYDTMLNMSILYDKRLKKAFKWIWIVFAIVIIISMVFAFSGGAGPV
jgi:hypothetical protein